MERTRVNTNGRFARWSRWLGAIIIALTGQAFFGHPSQSIEIYQLKGSHPNAWKNQTIVTAMSLRPVLIADGTDTTVAVKLTLNPDVVTLDPTQFPDEIYYVVTEEQTWTQAQAKTIFDGGDSNMEIQPPPPSTVGLRNSGKPFNNSVGALGTMINDAVASLDTAAQAEWALAFAYVENQMLTKANEQTKSQLLFQLAERMNPFNPLYADECSCGCNCCGGGDGTFDFDQVIVGGVGGALGGAAAGSMLPPGNPAGAGAGALGGGITGTIAAVASETWDVVGESVTEFASEIGGFFSRCWENPAYPLSGFSEKEFLPQWLEE